jgi:hypothetical protein
MVKLILFAEKTNVSIRCRAISYYYVLATTPGKERGFPERRERIIEGLPKTDWQFKNVSKENNFVSGPQN